MKILILGAGGMLGSSIYSVLKDKYNLVLVFKDIKEAELLDKVYGGVSNHEIKELNLETIYNNYLQGKGDINLRKFLNNINIDYVVNVMGIITPFSNENPGLTFFINSFIPQTLANIYGSKMIHLTTDCVFNGDNGFPYDENSIKTPIDIYGASKSLGESDKCLNIRSSFIGRELKTFSQLLEWFLSQEETVNGFTEHYWSGITAKELGRVIGKIVTNRSEFPETGTFHICSQPISKHDMLVKFKEKYKVDINIVKDNTTSKNRSLTTIKPFCAKLNIPSFDEMLEDL